MYIVEISNQLPPVAKYVFIHHTMYTNPIYVLKETQPYINNSIQQQQHQQQKSSFTYLVFISFKLKITMFFSFYLLLCVVAVT